MPIYTLNNVNYSYVAGSGVATVARSASATGAVTILSDFAVGEVTYQVTSIGINAFRSCSGLTSVTIPNSVTSIGEFAFQVCSGLTSLTIPDSVTIIGEHAFESCSGLTSLTIPSSVTSIGNYAFGGCTSLINIVVNAYISNFGPAFFGLNNVGLSITFNYVGAIPDGACNGRSNLTSVTIGSNITSIGQYAFGDCSGLTSVTIPSSVTSIGRYPFWNSVNLISINVDPANPNYSSDQYGVLFDKNKTTILEYPRGRAGSYTVPDGVTTILDYTFGVVNSSDSKITEITFPSSLTSIEDNAFYNCNLLLSVIFLGAIPTIGTNFTVSGDTAYVIEGTNTSSLTMFTNVIVGSPPPTPPTPPTTTYIHQNFYLTEEFDVSANNITAAIFDAEATTDVSGNYPNKAEIRVEKSVIQNMFQYWTDAIDMSNAVVSDIFYRVSYTNSAAPLSPDFVVGAIMTHSDPNMNPDSNLTNYLPQDYLRYLAKQLFNTTRGVDLFANETEVLQSVNTRCRVGLNQILLTYLDASANGIIRDEDDFIILDPYDPVEVAGSQKVTGNPAKKIMKQILQNDPARFVDISSNYAVAGQTYWYKVPIEVGDNLYFPVTIKAPTDQQKLTQPDSTTLIGDRTYLIRCVVVADGSIPSPYNVYSYSALANLTTFYH